MKVALIAGSTGLIGSQLLQMLIATNRYERIIALVRKELQPHPKLIQTKFDPSMQNLDPTWGVDDVFCCLGSTMAQSKSKEKFYQVDFTFPFLLARESLKVGAKQYLIVTALGAKKSAAIYYNRVKGQVEEAVSALGFNSVHIFRPSFLSGERSESRPAEEAAKVFYKVFGFMVPKKYKAIDSAKVATAMLHFASREQSGTHVHESDELQLF